MAQDYTVEQLNHGRKVIDFMRWDNVAFTISFLLLVASIAIISVKGFNGIRFLLEERLLRSISVNRPI